MQIKSLSAIISLALQEDNAYNDVTSDFTINEQQENNFSIVARQDMILSGINVLEETFLQLKQNKKFNQSKYQLTLHYQDGNNICANQIIASGIASTKLILAGERTILNILQHLSGIATKTNQLVKKLNNPNIAIFDTRKTLPGLRELQKYAVRCGGGNNHRFCLASQILIKDNHIASNQNIIETIKKAQSQNTQNLLLEVECDNINQVKEAILANPDIIMLDNMSIHEIINCCKIIRNHHKSIIIEVSGSINSQNIHLYNELDINRISIGSLTHSVNSIDIGLDFL
jgi:nicotinate-nucleotide pyrophosphorylase (carboxylating)